MNTAELKLDLFRKIDKLDNRKLEKIYNSLIGLLNADSLDETSLSPELKIALDEALDGSKKGKVHTHEDVMHHTKEKYSNLFK
jgi:hypothetical protein